MERIDGPPLKGPVPLEKALDYAQQILDALDAAHSKGITHRDLKPGNILVTKAGIKLLDFGLARFGQTAEPLKDDTLTMALTGKNEIVGTIYYMSPEQLQSKEADARRDIFAFGLVLYEMITGKRAFEGATAASVIAAIMERPAPSIAYVAPPVLDWVLKLCLEKDPANRWQDARFKIGAGTCPDPVFRSRASSHCRRSGSVDCRESTGRDSGGWRCLGLVATDRAPGNVDDASVGRRAARHPDRTSVRRLRRLAPWTLSRFRGSEEAFPGLDAVVAAPRFLNCHGAFRDGKRKRRVLVARFQVDWFCRG